MKWMEAAAPLAIDKLEGQALDAATWEDWLPGSCLFRSGFCPDPGELVGDTGQVVYGGHSWNLRPSSIQNGAGSLGRDPA